MTDSFPEALPASLPGAYVCPRCHGSLVLDRAASRLTCSRCAARFPVAGGVPYLVFEGHSWYRKLRELVLYHDFYQKIKTGCLERDRFAGKEEEARVTFGYMRHYFELAREEIDFSGRPRILDVGAGCGEVAQRLAEAGAEAYAVDINMFDLHHDLRLIAFADLDDFDYNRVFRGVPIDQPLFSRAIADADHLPFAPGYFDYVVMRAVAHHVLDLHHFFGEMNRVLRPGGRLILITEPFSSVLDNLAEYTEHDVDWQEGIMENRPRYPQYSSALAEAGFGDVTVKCFHAGFGFRLSRLIQRLRLPWSLEWLWEKPIRGWHRAALPFMAGVMNLYAVKKRDTVVYQSAPSATLEPPLPELLVGMAQDLNPARALLRAAFPVEQLKREHNLATETDRGTLRGVREVEQIGGRSARYLLTDFFCLLDARAPATRVCVEYHAQQLRGQESLSVHITVDDQPVSVVLNYEGWQVLSLPIPAEHAHAVELRIQQPDLIRRQFAPDSEELRDVGLAVRRVWVE